LGLEAFDDGGAVGGDKVFEDATGAGGGDALGADVVFEGDGDAGERAGGAVIEFALGGFGLGEGRFGVDGEISPEGVIAFGDGVEEGLGDFDGTDLALPECLCDLGGRSGRWVQGDYSSMMVGTMKSPARWTGALARACSRVRPGRS
jgi:hypothetical protein